MLKKIRVDQLEIGMHVHALCGPWLAHPFWRTSFLLEKAEVLDKLRASPVQELWIDTDRGRDLPAPPPTAPTTPPAAEGPVTLGSEVQRAAALCAEARDAVMHMFSEARMGQAVDMTTAQNLVQEITSSVERHPDALISVARLKTLDNYTYMHSVAVCGLMVALAKKLGHTPGQVHQAGMAGLLHDMGKAHMDLQILNKPGALTEAEFAQMKLHPVRGHAMLQACVQDAAVLHACLHHHERLDGRGYPQGLAGDAIPLLTRMATICDIYDAITSDRPYKQAWSPGIALQRMSEWCGGHLDAQLFESFVKTMGIYPIGSLVRLQSGLLGVVCAPAQASLSTPQVMAFYHVGQQRLLRPARLLDLRQLPEERIVSREDPAQWPFQNLDSLWQKAATALA
jgi:HD-GYP domain-containing protein (c-di-GMP phosphodiesterase class II)